MKAIQDTEPPSRLSSPIFMLGQNSLGNWVVREQSGSRGGLFINRAEALRYIRSENGNHTFPTVMVAGVLELEIAGTNKKIVSMPCDKSARLQLQVA
jgi:hypothetical protein